MAEEREYEQYAPQAAGGRLFTNAMFGFNKEEVLEYLEELADENNQRQQSAQQHIEELNSRLQEMENRLKTQDISDSILMESEQSSRRIQELSEAVEVAQTAARQAAEELQGLRDQVSTAQSENDWLREEHRKSDKQIAELRRQLDDASQGQWYGADEQITELRRQLEEVLAERDAAEAERDAAEAERDLVRVERDNVEAERDALEAERDSLEESYRAAARHTQDDVAGQAAATIVAEATEEAERIRAEAYAERERVHRQIMASAAGLAGSITTLREDISSVEGDVSAALETVQTTLADVLGSLGRTEQSLDTLGVQAERFPASSPRVAPRQGEVMVFQPSEQVAPAPRARRSRKASAPASYGSGGFNRVWPEDDATPARPRTFQPTTIAGGKGSAYTTQAAARVLDIDPDYDEEEERLRALTDTLVDTLRQMLE